MPFCSPAAIPVETVSLEAERPQPEADNSSPSYAEIKSSSSSPYSLLWHNP